MERSMTAQKKNNSRRHKCSSGLQFSVITTLFTGLLEESRGTSAGTWAELSRSSFTRAPSTSCHALTIGDSNWNQKTLNVMFATKILLHLNVKWEQLTLSDPLTCLFQTMEPSLFFASTRPRGMMKYGLGKRSYSRLLLKVALQPPPLTSSSSCCPTLKLNLQHRVNKHQLLRINDLPQRATIGTL